MNAAPLLMALGAARAVRRLIEEGYDFDLIDAHYYYPDGVAAALLSKWFHKPFVVTARGTDINLISQYAIPRKLIRWAAGQARASIAVSRALSERLEEIGVEQSKSIVLRNGVDVARFYPTMQTTARAELGWADEPTLISVGNLVENKGHHVGIELLVKLPEFRLVIVGAGPERESLEQLARSLGVAQRVLFAGRIAQKNLAVYYSAADILILASSREGWPNVLLEAMACGTPVVATNVGGIPEVVTSRTVGRLTSDRSVAGFLPLVQDLWGSSPDRAAVRQHAESCSWDETTRAQLELFSKIKNA
jgi:glycosyltransferase involved in cell wall biosynthesis